MHDIHVIRSQHLELSAQRHALKLLGALEHFASGTGDTAKAKTLIDEVYAPVRAAAEKPPVTGPHTYQPSQAVGGYEKPGQCVI